MLLALATVALTFAAAPARAQAPLTVKLEFRGEDGCPDEQEFLKRLDSRATIRLVEQAEALRLRVSLARVGKGARGELRAGAENSSDAREVEAGSCNEVADALALIAALMIERTKREQASRPPAAPPAPKPFVKPTATPAPTRRRIELGLSALATRPMTSPPLLGAGVSLYVASSLTWWLSAHYSRNDSLAAPSAARFGFGGLVLGVGPPALNLGSRLQLACALAVEGAFLSAEAVNVDVASSARRSYWAAGLLGRARWEATNRVVFFLEVGGFVPWVERRFSTREPYVVVGQTSSIAPRAALGLAMRL